MSHGWRLQEDVVVSRYISNPLLVDGYKFDLRIYVAVTSFEPLRAYIFDEVCHAWRYTHDTEP